MKIILTDTFNNRILSQHRTVAAAVSARLANVRSIRRRNGSNSYLTYSITAADGSDIRDDVEAEEINQQWK